MKSDYKVWMLIHCGVLAFYLASEILFSAFDYENKYPFNSYLLVQAFLSIILWFLIRKRLFVPAYYLACIIVILSTYNFYTYMTQEYSFLPSYINAAFKYLAYITVIFYTIFIYVFLAYYPNKVMKTARKLRLTNT